MTVMTGIVERFKDKVNKLNKRMDLAECRYSNTCVLLNRLLIRPLFNGQMPVR